MATRMQQPQRQSWATNTTATAASSSRSTSTTVDTTDVVHRYEILLAQLSQQALEQQAEIQTLRDALQCQHSTAPALPQSSNTITEQQHPKQPRRQHAHRRSSSHRHRKAHAASSAADGGDRAVVSTVGPATPFSLALPTRATLSPPCSPPVSPIRAANVSAVSFTDSHAAITTAAAAAATPPRCSSDVALAPANSRQTPQRTASSPGARAAKMDETCDDSCTVSECSGGLSPSPAAHATQASRRSANNYMEKKNHSTRQQQQLKVSPTKIDGDTALDYLLTVFSTIKKERRGHSTADVCGAPSNTVRQLFAEAEEEEGSNVSSSTSSMPTAPEHTSSPMSPLARAETAQAIGAAHGAPLSLKTVQVEGEVRHCGASVKVFEDAVASTVPSWQQRYARLVAVTEEEKEEEEENKTTTTHASAHHTSFSVDRSASELVDDLLHFFTA